VDIKQLRARTDHHGADGLPLLSASLRGHSPERRRRTRWIVGALCLIPVLGLAGWYGKRVLGFVPPAPSLDSPLYLAKASEHGSSQPGRRQETVAEAIDRAWGSAGKTPGVQQLIQKLAAAVEHRQLPRVAELGGRLFHLLPPPPAKGPLATTYPRDKNWGFRTALGEIYLQQGWPEASLREFRTVLAAVPAGAAFGSLRRSPARQGASYGMARAMAMSGDYQEASHWLDLAPSEFWEECVSCQESKMLLDYPTRCVWQTAQLPFDRARPQLLQIMVGQFEPRRGQICKGTEEPQKEKAAVEAAATLGWLYLQHGDRVDARRAFARAAQARSDAYEAGKLAQAALRAFF
jgi:hypothetical protein